MCALVLCALAAAASVRALDQPQLERYDAKYRRYQVAVPGKEPITIIEAGDRAPLGQWVDVALNVKDNDSALKNIMTDIIHDDGERPRCYGPSCRDGYAEDGTQGDVEEFLAEYPERSKDFGEYPKDRLQAISALAAKLKNDRLKSDRYYGQAPVSLDQGDDDGEKVHTAWNKMKVKQHKHPYDDKDGWVSLEPIAWSTSKISKWKPNVKKHRPSQWNDDEDERYGNSDDSKYIYEGTVNNQNNQFKKPTNQRPTYINNQLHGAASSNWNSEVPRPSWNKPDDYYSYPSAWNPDEGRKPQKPNCDHEESESPHDHDATVFYGLSDSGLITDSRPSHSYDYEALKRPFKRPTQVVYAGSPELDGDRSSRPPHGDGHWVLLSTTKGYRNKKRQRSLSVDASEPLTITAHQAVGLTVLPMETPTNMTTSHGGLLEVERSFKTVEESKRDMDRRNEFRPDPLDQYASSSNPKPVKQKLVQKKYMTTAPDSSAVLAAVGAGLVPATMAMVVPMMLGRKKRDLSEEFRRDAVLKYD